MCREPKLRDQRRSGAAIAVALLVIAAISSHAQGPADVAAYRQLIDEYRAGRRVGDADISRLTSDPSLVGRIVEPSNGWSPVALTASAMLHTDLGLLLVKKASQPDAGAEIQAAVVGPLSGPQPKRTPVVPLDARSERREIAMRLALGASRGRLACQLLTESSLLAVLGGVAACVTVTWTSAWLQRTILPAMAWKPTGAVDLSVISIAALCVFAAAFSGGWLRSGTRESTVRPPFAMESCAGREDVRECSPGCSPSRAR